MISSSPLIVLFLLSTETNWDLWWWQFLLMAYQYLNGAAAVQSHLWGCRFCRAGEDSTGQGRGSQASSLSIIQDISQRLSLNWQILHRTFCQNNCVYCGYDLFSTLKRQSFANKTLKTSNNSMGECLHQFVCSTRVKLTMVQFLANLIRTSFKTSTRYFLLWLGHTGISEADCSGRQPCYKSYLFIFKSVEDCKGWKSTRDKRFNTRDRYLL